MQSFRLMAALVVSAFTALGVTAFAQTNQLQTPTVNLPYQQPGPRLIDGAVINGLIVRTNSGSCYTVGPLGGATLPDSTITIATGPMYLVSASVVYSANNGATQTLQLTKDVGTNAPGAGSDLLATPFDLNTTANTVQNGALVTTSATKTFAAGNRLGYDFSGTTAAQLAGLVVTACLMPLSQ